MIGIRAEDAILRPVSRQTRGPRHDWVIRSVNERGGFVSTHGGQRCVWTPTVESVCAGGIAPPCWRSSPCFSCQSTTAPAPRSLTVTRCSSSSSRRVRAFPCIITVSIGMLEITAATSPTRKVGLRRSRFRRSARCCHPSCLHSHCKPCCPRSACARTRGSPVDRFGRIILRQSGHNPECTPIEHRHHRPARRCRRAPEVCQHAPNHPTPRPGRSCPDAHVIRHAHRQRARAS